MSNHLKLFPCSEDNLDYQQNNVQYDVSQATNDMEKFEAQRYYFCLPHFINNFIV